MLIYPVKKLFQNFVTPVRHLNFDKYDFDFDLALSTIYQISDVQFEFKPSLNTLFTYFSWLNLPHFVIYQMKNLFMGFAFEETVTLDVYVSTIVGFMKNNVFDSFNNKGWLAEDF
jgi:hypothetical protein